MIRVSWPGASNDGCRFAADGRGTVELMEYFYARL